jgi:hypothetical protein
MDNAGTISYQSNSDPIKNESLTVDCPHCDQHFSEGSIKIATFLYGAFFLVGKEIAYFGITCPSCLKTIYKKDGVQNINVTLNYLSSPIDLADYQFDANLRYFSSTSTFSEKIPELEMFDIRPYEFCSSPDSFENDIMGILYHQEECPDLAENYLCSFITSGPPFMGYSSLILWFKPEEVKNLVKIENDDGIKIFPRYYYQCPLIEEVNLFCWENYLYVKYLIGLRENLNEEKEKLNKAARLVGIDSDKIEEFCKNNLGTDPQVLDFYQKQFEDRKAEDFCTFSKFFKILVSDSGPWDIPFSYFDSYKDFCKTKVPFLGTKIPESFSSINPAKFDKKSVTKSYQKKVDEIKPKLTKGYVQDFLSKSYLNFIKDYVNLSKKPFFSFAHLWELKEKYLDSLYDHVKNEGLHESKCVFYPEGGSWRITYNGKTTGGYSGTGFKYLHFLISNKFKSFGFDDLDLLDGVEVREMKKYFEFDKDPENDPDPQVAIGSGPRKRASSKPKKVDYENPEFHHRDMISRSNIQNLKIHRQKLMQELEEAENSNDLPRIEKAQSELDSFNNYFYKYFTKGGRIKKFKGDSKKIRDKINVAIRRAMDSIKNYDFNAWKHIETSLDREKGMLSYRPDTDIEWFTG